VLVELDSERFPFTGSTVTMQVRVFVASPVPNDLCSRLKKLEGDFNACFRDEVAEILRGAGISASVREAPIDEPIRVLFNSFGGQERV
jgi:hypothetical protein